MPERMNIFQKVHQFSDRISSWWSSGQPGKAETLISEHTEQRLFQSFGRAIDRIVDAASTPWEASEITVHPETKEDVNHLLITGLRTVCAGVGIVALTQGAPVMAAIGAGVGLFYPKLMRSVLERMDEIPMTDLLHDRESLTRALNKIGDIPKRFRSWWSNRNSRMVPVAPSVVA